MTIAEEKRELRRNYLRMRKALSRETVEKRSYKIMNRLQDLLNPNIHSVLFYVPINREVDLLPLAKMLFIQGKSVLFPRLVNYDKIEACLIHDLFFDFKPGAYNIPEPDTEVYQHRIDIAFIPGIVFGRNGYRIGYGKSYYDRYLAGSHIKKTVGVCYDFQLLLKIPYDDHDFCLDTIVSETETLILPE